MPPTNALCTTRPEPEPEPEFEEPGVFDEVIDPSTSASIGAGITGASATVEATPDKHEPCYTIPSGRRRNKVQDCQLKGKCEFV